MPPLGGNDACVALHAALRKVCDSEATTVLYQIVHLVCALRIRPESLDPWRIVGRLVAESLNEAHARGERIINPYISVTLAFEKLEDVWWSSAKKRREKSGRDSEPENAREALYAFTRCFRLLTPEDRIAMAEYLRDDED